MLPNIIDEVKSKILPVLYHHKVKRAALFGSIVRGELREDSDVDVLVEIDKGVSLLDFIGIKQELEDQLNRRVDLVEYGMLKPRIKDTVLKEQLVIL